MMERTRKFYETVRAQANAVFVALDERDSSTFLHSNRVGALAVELGEACSLSERELELLLLSAGFHDIGKIGIPDTVLKKRTPFDEQDWAIMKVHPIKSQRIISAAKMDDGETVGLAVRHHHERFDGTGYPDKLSGESIPVLARIVAIVDTYDAMTTTRVYGDARSHVEVMAVLHAEQGRQHDPYLIGKFAQLIEHSKFKARERNLIHSA